MNTQEKIKQKVGSFFGLVGKYKSVRYAFIFVMICLGIFIISASKISFFGINIERDLGEGSKSQKERSIGSDYIKNYNLFRDTVDEK